MEEKAVIKFCVKLGKSVTKLLEMLRVMYSDDSPSHTTAYV